VSHRLRGLILAALLSPGVALATPSPTVWVPPLPVVETIDEARLARAQAAYDRASRAFARARYRDALAHADEAFEAVPNASTALVRATVLDAMQRHQEAFEAYLLTLDLSPTDDERARAVEGLRAHGMVLGHGWLRVTAEPPDAALVLGEARWVGARALGVPADVELRVEARHPEREAAGLSVSVAPGEGAELTLSLPPPPPPEPEPPPPELPEPPATVDRDPLPWVLLGGGGALVAAGLVTHILAFDAAADADAAARPGSVEEASRRQRYDAAVDRKDRLEVASWVLYAVGVGAAATGAVLALIRPSGGEGAGAITLVPTGPGAMLITSF